MKRTMGRILLACLALMVISGCRTSTVQNVTDTSIVNATGKQLSLDDVTRAIVEAGAEHKWSMTVEKPGHIVGRLNLRSHTAVVDIPYSTTSYSILYKDSTNLKYDEADKTIHSNYNGWVQNLDAAIKLKLSQLH
jgi:hypothetical protein